VVLVNTMVPQCLSPPCQVITLDTAGANYRSVWAMHKHFPHIKTFVRAFDIENGAPLGGGARPLGCTASTCKSMRACGGEAACAALHSAT